MRFTPLTEEELQMQALVPEGVYSYQVLKAEEKISKAGNDYISLTLRIWDNEGREHSVFTNLALVKLLKHFCDVNGMQSTYQSGNVNADNCNGLSGGRVMLGVEEAKPKPDGGMYNAKNIVKDYIVAPQGSMSAPAAMRPLPDAKDAFYDDSVPF